MFNGYEGGASQFAGGGFMPSPANAHDTSASPAQAKSKGTVQTLRALTVRQIYEGTLNSTDDQYRIDGEELHNITLVGKIIQASEQPTHLQFQLDDGTGKIDLSYWTSDDDQDMVAQRRADWRVGVYIRVHGHLRSFENKKNIVIFSLKVIHDFNEVSYHLLQCIFQHAHLTRGQARGSGMNANRGSLPPAAAASNGAGGFGAPDEVATAHMEPVQRDCYRIFNTPEAHVSEVGVTMDTVIGQLGNRYSIPAIKQAVEWLSGEGHLYTTTDDTCFKSTNA